MSPTSPAKKPGRTASNAVLIKDHPLLKVVDLELNGRPEVGTLVWARVEGSVYWPAFIVQEYVQSDNVDEISENVSVIFMEKRFRAAKVKWSRVIIAELLNIGEQTALITSLNRTLGKKGWNPNRAYSEGLKLWEQFQKIEASQREISAEQLFEQEVNSRKEEQKKRVTEGPKSSEKVEVLAKRRFTDEPVGSSSSGLKKSDKVNRAKHPRYSLRSPPPASSPKAALPTTSKKSKDTSNASKTDLNNNVNGSNPGPNSNPAPPAMINKKTGRPLHGGELLKKWTQMQFDRVDKKFVFDSSPDLTCAKCKLLISNESPAYCHEYPFHTGCLTEVSSGTVEDGQEKTILKCEDCFKQNCFVCKKSGNAIKCSKCSLKFHRECLKKWPQATIQGLRGPITCPLHFCHTCKAEERCLNKMRNHKLVNNKAYRCIHCLSAYHKAGCLPAGCADTISGHAFIECPKHTERFAVGRKLRGLGCFSCNKRLIDKDVCVECTTCYMIFHPACIGYTDEDKAEGISLERFAENFQCNNCCWGLFPLYGQVVWFQQPGSSFWPARILYPKESAVRSKENKTGLYSIVYFGSKSTYFDSVVQSVPFHIAGIDFLTKLNLYNEKPALLTAYEEAGYALTHSETHRDGILHKPEPDYKRIDRNVYRNGKRIDVTKSNKDDAMVCNCDKLNEPDACVANSGCYNRDSSVECNKDNCSAPDKCKNRMFSLSNKANDHLEVFATKNKGWGIKATRQIAQGEFIIEYVGEVISRADMSWRVGRKHEEDPRYILDLGSNLYIDAEYVGNISRLINHSCDPNCVTEKYNSLNRPVVGVFAARDIAPGEELSFDYAYGKDRSSATFRCYCSTENCKGFIGNRAKDNEENFKPNLKRKRVLEEDQSTKETEDRWNNNCEECTFGGHVILCDYEDCRYVFHLKCAGLKKPPKGEWTCRFHPPENEKIRKKSLKKKTVASSENSTFLENNVEPVSVSPPNEQILTPKSGDQEPSDLLKKKSKRAKTSNLEFIGRRDRNRSSVSLRNRTLQLQEINTESPKSALTVEAILMKTPLPIDGTEAVNVLDKIPSNLSHVTPKTGEQEDSNPFKRKSKCDGVKRSNPRLPDRSRNIESIKRKESSILLRLLSRSSPRERIEGEVEVSQKDVPASLNETSIDASNLTDQLPSGAPLPSCEQEDSNSSSRIKRFSSRVPERRERTRTNVSLRNRTSLQYTLNESSTKMDTEVETEVSLESCSSPKNDPDSVNVLDQIAPSNVSHLTLPICDHESSNLTKRKSKSKRIKQCTPKVPERCRSSVGLRSRPLLLQMVNTSV